MKKVREQMTKYRSIFCLVKNLVRPLTTNRAEGVETEDTFVTSDILSPATNLFAA